MAKIDGLEIVMTKQIKKMIDKELKKRFEELKPELATRYEELLNMRNMEADQFNDGFNDARAGKLETDQPHYDLDTDNWRLGYAWGMFEPMKEKLARERQVSDAEIEELGAQEAERKEFCPNCEAETPCTHEAELFVCDICGEDFAKYIVSRNCNVSDVSMTRDVSIDIKTPTSIENTNPDYYKQELSRRDEIIARLKEDGERLASTYVIEVFPHEWVCRGGCHHWARFGEQIEHSPDCPITLHRTLMKELE